MIAKRSFNKLVKLHQNQIWVNSWCSLLLQLPSWVSYELGTVKSEPLQGDSQNINKYSCVSLIVDNMSFAK